MFPQDAHWMRRALVLARTRAGATWPNPTVGACVVHAGRLLGEGVHAGPGSPHAEIVALRDLRAWGVDPKQLTVYVTLEPCHHQGRTPPCSLALAEAGVGRLVYAVDDEHAVARGGARWLAEQGVEVRRGPFTREAWELNHPFFETGGGQTPHVTLKLASTLDGRLARRRGPVADPEERRVTGERAQRRVHRLRASASCVVVGRGTVEADAPRLTVRQVATSRQPRPVVLDAQVRTPASGLPSASLVLCGPQAAPARLKALRDAGHEAQACAVDDAGRLAWPSILQALTDRGLGIVMVEGGEAVARSALASGVVHRLHLLVAPRTFGGDGPRVPDDAVASDRFERLRVRAVGEDVEWVLRRRGLPVPAR